MHPFRITAEEFAELLQILGHDELPSSPPQPELSAESLLLSRAASIAVADRNVSLILSTLKVADDLGLSITLEPQCKTSLQAYMNSTN